MNQEPPMIYVATMPRQLRPGLYLCHNHIVHNKRTKPGVNGFRAWFVSELHLHFKPCKCGWSGLKHYSRQEKPK